ncbi:MAG TPA: hypothetical protein VIY86_12755 [Pirellulaceae bacterium]
MADTPPAHMMFSSWLRRGLATGIERVDGSDSGGPRTEVKLALRFSPDEVARPQLTLVGPGDVAGLDSRAIVRTFPAADVNEAESGYFVSVEFDQADLPWRYTPARYRGDKSETPGASTDKLRPWLTLLVLRGALADGGGAT